MRGLAILICLVSLNLGTFAEAQVAKMPVFQIRNAAGARNYSLFVPDTVKFRARRQSVPLFIVLHGCLQSSEIIAADSGMNEMAKQLGLIVAYPEQTRADNILSCWNWFKPANLKRGSGEISILADLIEELKVKLPVNPSQVYVMGISAGGAMAANLAACYSDKIAGVGIASGLTYLAATSDNEAQKVMKSGPTKSADELGLAAANCAGKENARPLTVVTVQGTTDSVVGAVNAEAIVKSFAVMNDWTDDGQANGSQTSQVIQSQVGQVQNGRRYLMESYGNPKTPTILRVMVDGMGHAWSGSTSGGQYTDAKGPPATSIMLKHFSNQSRAFRR